jgi:hypothetical protein
LPLTFLIFWNFGGIKTKEEIHTVQKLVTAKIRSGTYSRFSRIRSIFDIALGIKRVSIMALRLNKIAALLSEI